MKDKVYPSSSVIPYHDKFIWANLNVDLQAVRKVMPQFSVRGVPYIVILSPDGEILGVNRGLIKSEAFVQLLDSALAQPGATKLSLIHI